MKEADKKLAYELYMSTELSQRDIAERVGVTEKTISQWKTQGRWDIQKAALNVTPKVTIAGFLMQLEAMRKSIADRKENPWPTAAESDIIMKITKSMKMLQRDLTLSDYINAFEQLFKFINTSNPKLAREVLDFQNEFIQLKAKELAQ
jgi:DNA-binding XRE family transcriptional regulator